MMTETGKNRLRAKKRVLALLFGAIFFLCVFGKSIRTEAATYSETLNAVIPLIVGCNENGEPVGISFGIPFLTEGSGIILVSSEAYLGTCSAYVMSFYTENGSVMEIVTPFAASEENKLVLFYLQPDSAFTASFRTGGMENVTSDTKLLNVLLSDEGELYEKINYCTGKEGNFYKLAYSSEDMLGGSLVLNVEEEAVVGVVAAEGDGTYFVDIEAIRVLYQSAVNSGAGGSGAGGTGGQGAGGTGGYDTGGESAGSSGVGGGGFWGAVILGIVIVLGVLLYGYSKKSKTGEEKPECEPDILQDGASLMGISGIHAGAVFPLDELLVFGRDKNRCNLIFPGDTQGISGVHCQIRPVESGVELMDLGSSYGTFLQDGTRLTPHTPYVLRKGDGFYLADRQYSYKVQ